LKPLVILGIDPGTIIMGYGVVTLENKEMKCIDLDAIKFNSKRSPFERLQDIHDQMSLLFKKFDPDFLAMEAPFYGKNIQSMLKLGRAQGVIMSSALDRGIPVDEYSPRKVKMAITGNGASSKERVAKMLESIFRLEKIKKPMDASDGLAVATCHAFQIMSPVDIDTPNKLKNRPKGKGKGSWNSFLKNNPDRLKS